MAPETPPVLDGTIALFFLFAGFAMMYYSGYVSAVVDAIFRPHSCYPSGSLLALPAHSGSLPGTQLALLPHSRSPQNPLVPSLQVLPSAVDMRFLVQVPPFQRPLHNPYGPTAVTVYSPYKPSTIPPPNSNVPDVSIGLQGANCYLYQTMAATPLLYLFHSASTAAVSSSQVLAGGEEGSLALFITLTLMIFIALLFWAFNRHSGHNGKMENFGLRRKRKRAYNGLSHIERRHLSEYWFSHMNEVSGLSLNHVLMPSSSLGNDIIFDNILKFHTAPNIVQSVYKKYDGRNRNMVIKRMSEFQEVMNGPIVVISRRWQHEENSLAIKILVELNNYSIPTSMRIEVHSGIIMTIGDMSPYRINGMEVQINYENRLTRKMESLIFKIEDLLAYFQSYLGWNITINRRGELLIDMKVNIFHQMVRGIIPLLSTFAISSNGRPSSSLAQSGQIWKALDERHDELPINARVVRFPHLLNTNTILLSWKSAPLELEAVRCSDGVKAKKRNPVLHRVKAKKTTSPILYAHYMAPTVSSQAKVLKPKMSTVSIPTFSCPNYMASTVWAKANVRTCSAVGGLRQRKGQL